MDKFLIELEKSTFVDGVKKSLAIMYKEKNNKRTAMKEEEIVENNKLIAEFMGGIIRESRYIDGLYREVIKEVVYWMDDYLQGYDGISVSNLKFNLSWDWLMPVVAKIETMSEYSSYKIETSCFFERDDLINSLYIERTIERTFENVVEFIEWYNENKR